MSGLNIGDRVELINDIGQRYHSRIGVITAADQHNVPVLKEFVVELADGGEEFFSGFQLKKPAATLARRLRDSEVSPFMTGMRGGPGDRHMIFGADDFDLHLKVVPTATNRKVLGQLSIEVLVPSHCMVATFDA